MQYNRFTRSGRHGNLLDDILARGIVDPGYRQHGLSMSDEAFDQEARLARIGYAPSRAPTLEALQALIAARADSAAAVAVRSAARERG